MTEIFFIFLEKNRKQRQQFKTIKSESYHIQKRMNKKCN